MQESAAWLSSFDDLSSDMSSVPFLEELFLVTSLPLIETIPDTTSESSVTSGAGSMSSTESLDAQVLSKTRSKAAKPRRSHLQQVQALQHELETLMLQVESLRTNQLLGNSLEQFLNPKRYRPNYRLLATDSKQAAEHAQIENARLKIRVRERMTQIRSVRRLLTKQFAIAKVQTATYSTARSPIDLDLRPSNAQIRQTSALDPPRSALFTSQDADLRLYSMLCSNLDMRCAQIGSVLSQCASVAVPSELSQVVLHADGAGVDFKTSRVLPFTAEIVCKALYKAVNVDSALDSDLVSAGLRGLMA